VAVEPGYIVVQLDGNPIQRVAVSSTPLTIGRTPENSLSLPHPLVSRRHAEIRLAAEGVLITDLGSANGSFVGETRILADQPHLLVPGAVVRIGPFSLVYESGAVPATPPVEQPEAAEAPEATEQPAQPAPAATPRELPSELQSVDVKALRRAPVQPTLPASLAPRPHLPALRPLGPFSLYLQDMPIIYHDNEFLGRYLMIMENLWEPLEQRQTFIDMYFDPETCPASFLPWLASWMGLASGDILPEPRRRQLLSEVMELYRWRGTRYGLTRMIEVCTGLTPEIREDPRRPSVLLIRMTIPASSGVDSTLVETLIRSHKPAHVGYILELHT